VSYRTLTRFKIEKEVSLRELGVGSVNVREPFTANILRWVPECCILLTNLASFSMQAKIHLLASEFLHLAKGRLTIRNQRVAD
jgi:hypothetical protein